jgi:putative ABC transport system substrate-binding protein
MRRREFITLVGSAVVMPLAADAQQVARPRQVAVLNSFGEGDPQGQAELKAFQRGLEDLGWSAERNVHFEYRWFANNVERARTFAKELVGLQPDVIFARATPSVEALLQLTQAIPIVFVSVSDPVGQGFVSNLARPGGNITGFTAFEFSIGGKLVQTLKEVAPSVRRAAVIFNPKTAPYFQLFLNSIESAAAPLPVQTVAVPLHEASDIEGAIATFAREPDGGLIFISDGFSMSNRKTVIALAARHRLPAIYPFRVFVTDGGLVAYGVDPIEQFRRAASYVDRILRGERPGELPIQQPTKFELVINLRTAKTLGLTVSPALLARADEVIE